MADTVTLKIQQKILVERITMGEKQKNLVHNLRSTKARSKFIQEANLNFNIYKFVPNDYLELVEEGKKPTFPEKYELYKELKDKEAARKEKQEEIEKNRRDK